MALKEYLLSVAFSAAILVLPGFSAFATDVVLAPPITEKDGQVYLGSLLDVRDEMIAAKNNFTEIDLDGMKANIYRDGQVDHSFGIIKAKAGLATGVFSVLSKTSLVFSFDAGAYLPDAVNYYGNCYFHAEPYLLAGEKHEFFSGAECLRFDDGDAKTIYDNVKVGEPVLVISGGGKTEFPKKTGVMPFPALAARSFLVADLDSGFILAEKNSQTVLPIASITKLMTATVVKEWRNLKSPVRVQPVMLNAYGGTRGLVAGGYYALEQLYYPLLQESSNDAAEIISDTMGRDGAVGAMNQRAKSLSMQNTYFTDAHGVSAANVSTARDLFYLTRYVADFQPDIFDITKGVKPADFSASIWPYLRNKNFFCAHPSFVGGKTGYIVESKYNGVFVFNLALNNGEKRRVAIVILGAPHWDSGYSNLRDEVVETLVWFNHNYTLAS